MEEWISLRKFAKRRGVALSAVQKAIDSGRVTAVRRDDAGRLSGIEFGAAMAQWDALTDPVQAARTGQVLGLPGAEQVHQLPLEAPKGEPAASATLDEDADRSGYYAHRAKREEFQAKTAELEYLEAIGALVPARELREAAVRRYRAIRDKVLNIPDRQAAVLVGEARSGDPSTAEARVHALLSKELKRVLHELSDDALAEAAGGPAERLEA